MRTKGVGCQELRDENTGFFTGQMTDCVCVIVRWKENNDIKMNGFHGSGGIHEVNFASLLQNAPNHHTTSIIVIPGRDLKSEWNLGFIEDTVDTEIQLVGKPRCCVEIHTPDSAVYIDRELNKKH